MRFFSSRVFWHLAIVLAVVIPAGYYIFQELQIAGTLGFPLDDSWIHMVFARNITAGDFFAYNSHQPVAGTTAPLWSLLLALGFVVSDSPVLMSFILGVLLNIGLGFIIYRFALYLGMRESTAALSAIVLLTATGMVWGSTSGMEVPLYAFLTFASIYMYFRYAADSTWRKYLGIIIAGIAVSARPELILLPIFYFVHQIALRRKPGAKTALLIIGNPPDKPLGFREMIKQAVVFAVFAAPFFILNLSLSGTFFPLTFTAKTSTALASKNSGQRASELMHGSHFGLIIHRSAVSLWSANVNVFKWLWVPANAALACIGIATLVFIIIVCVRRGIRSRLESALMLLAVNSILYAPIRYVATGTESFGQYGRYAAHLTPIMMFLGILGVHEIFNYIGKKRTLVGVSATAAVCAGSFFWYYRAKGFFGMGHQMPITNMYLPYLQQCSVSDIIAYLVLLIITVSCGIYYLNVRVKSVTAACNAVLVLFICFAIVENAQVGVENGWNVKNINDCQITIGKWLAQNTPPKTLYATCDIGAMKYYAENDTILDLMGLVHPQIVEKMAAAQTGDDVCGWSLKQYHPQYLICFNGMYEDVIAEGRKDGTIVPVLPLKIVNNITCGVGPACTEMDIYRVNMAENAGNLVKDP